MNFNFTNCLGFEIKNFCEVSYNVALSSNKILHITIKSIGQMHRAEQKIAVK